MVKVNMKEVRAAASNVADSQERRGGKVDYMKLGPGTNKIFVLPPYDSKTVLKRLYYHEMWKNGKPTMKVGSPRIDEGGEDPVMERGFKLKEKYEDSSSEKKQKRWLAYMPKDEVVINALDLKKKNPTVQVLRLPSNALKFLLEELDEIEDGDDIWDLDKGFPLIIKGNGKNGKLRRYEIVKWAKQRAKLLQEERVDEEEILEALYDLDKLQPKEDEKKLKKFMQLLKQQDLKIFKGRDDDDEDDEDDDDEPRSRKSKRSKKRSRDDDEDEDDVEDDEDEEDEVDADDDDDDEFEDDDEEDDSDDEDEEDDDDLEDDEEDDEPPKKKKGSRKSSKKKSSRKGGLRKKRR